MISWTDELAAQQRQQEMLDRALEEYDVSQMLPKSERKDGIITRGLHSLGERLVIAGVRLQLLNRQMGSSPRSG